MKPNNLNLAFLQRVLRREQEDHWYHYGIASSAPLLERMKAVKAVVLAGSGERIDSFAATWATKRHAPILSLPKEERFTFRYVDGVIFSSHGMGMPSAAIAMQELMKMLYCLKDGDETALDKVFWLRAGTSGGLGLSPGTIVVSSESLQPDGKPYRLQLQGMEHYFDGGFPPAPAAALLQTAAACNLAAVCGKTVGCNDFYLEQGRRDGASCFLTETEKIRWLQSLHTQGVRNIEMETPVFAGLLNHWGFPRFSAACTVLLDRLQGDQVTVSPQQLAGYVQNTEQLMLAYLDSLVLHPAGT